MTKTQTERDEAQKATAEARERAGQLEAVQQQNAALLAAFKQEWDGSGKGKR